MASGPQDTPQSGDAATAPRTVSDPFYQRYGLTVGEVFEVAQTFYRAGQSGTGTRCLPLKLLVS